MSYPPHSAESGLGILMTFPSEGRSTGFPWPGCRYVYEELDKEIREVMIFEKADKASAVRMILEIGIDEWRKRYALTLLQEGRITYNKAAEVAKLTVWDLAELVKQRRVEWVRYTPEEAAHEVDEALKAESQ